MQRFVSLLIFLFICGAGGCATAISDVHVVTSNERGRETDIAVRIDDKLVFWGAAAVVRDRDPNTSFDLPLKLSTSSHTIVVESRGQKAQATFRGTRFVTIDVRLTSSQIEITVFQKRVLYL